MDKKKIIQIVVIVIAFGISALVLYNGFFKSSSKSALESLAPGAGTASTQDILPNGSGLDFGLLKQQHLRFGLVTYPKLDPKNEVGIPENQLIVPAGP